MNMEKYFLIDLKKLAIIIIAFIAAVILHNLISGIFGFEESVFFLLAVIVIPIYFVIMVAYTVFHHTSKVFKKKTKKK